MSLGQPPVHPALADQLTRNIEAFVAGEPAIWSGRSATSGCAARHPGGIGRRRRTHGVALVTIGIVTISDRASQGLYEDISGPAIGDWLARAITLAVAGRRRLVPDGRGRPLRPFSATSATASASTSS